jgi:hypothetical protein
MSFPVVLILFLFGVLARSIIVVFLWEHLAMQLGLPVLDLAHAVAVVLLVQVLTRYTPPGTFKEKIKEYERAKAGK